MYLHFSTIVFINTNFADSVTLKFTSYENGDRTGEPIENIVEATSEDAEALKEIFNGTFEHIGYSRSCGYGAVSIIFSSDNKILTIYTAGDDCNAFQMDGFEHSITIKPEDNKTMKEILRGYGAFWASDEWNIAS